jgi:hypothetical protein
MTTAAVSVDALREHILTANYPKAAATFCDLIKDGHRLDDLVRVAIDTTAPFVQAPSHVMPKADGTQRGVNYDHTVLGWRASLKMMPSMSGYRSLLPVAQAIWYVPQGLDVWSQINCDFPGHYARDQERCDDRDHVPPYDPPVSFDGPAWSTPKVHFEDHAPLLDGSPEERLMRMQYAIMQGERVEAYRLFLGLAGEPEQRTRLKDAILAAGIFDLQQTIIQRGGYQNIGHKALRARAMVDIADHLGWENSHGLFYTVVPDLGCMPRFFELWHVTTLMLPQEFRNWQQLKQVNTSPLTEEEIDETIDVVLWGRPEHVSAHLTKLLRRGRALLAIADALVIAFSRYELQVMQHPVSFFTPGHAFDYLNVVNHWLRTYDNPHQAKALYFAALFINDVIRANMMFPRDPAAEFEPPASHARAMAAKSDPELLAELEDACTVQDPSRALAAVDEYLSRTDERQALIDTLCYAAGKVQNDPHVERKCITSVEEYRYNQTSRKDDILRGWAKYVARAIRRSTALDCYDLYKREFERP